MRFVCLHQMAEAGGSVKMVLVEPSPCPEDAQNVAIFLGVFAWLYSFEGYNGIRPQPSCGVNQHMWGLAKRYFECWSGSGNLGQVFRKIRTDSSHLQKNLPHLRAFVYEESE